MSINKILKNNFLISFLVSIGIFIFIFYGTGGLFYGLDLSFPTKIKDIYSKNIINNNIILVEINKKTTNTLGWPFDRKNYIQVINNLKKSGAKVIAMDILFNDNSKKNINIPDNFPKKCEKILKESNTTDQKLANTFQKSGNIVIGGKIIKNHQLSTPIFLDKIFSKKNKNTTQNSNEKIFFQNSVKKIGYYNPIINKKTSKVYSIIPYTTLKNGIKIEHITFAITREFLEKNNKTKILGYNTKKSIYNFLDKKIPTIKKQFFIDFTHPKFFHKESFLNIYNGNFDEKKFKNKLVIIGYTVDGATDQYEVPGIGKIKGVYIILNTINNILNKTYTKNINIKIEAFLIFLITFLIIFFTISRENKGQMKWLFLGGFSIFIISFIIYFSIYIYYLQTYNIYIFSNFPTEFIVSIFLGFFSSTIFKYLKEDKNKKLLNKALGEYVSKDIAKEILDSTGKINLEGEKKNISIFFSDIEGFTSISEKMGAKELVIFLQQYLGNMSEIIMENKGFIDKYEGDAIMALWGIFGETGKTKSFDILESAILQQKKLTQLNKQFKITLGEELKVRMGIHLGEAIIGNIGAKGKKMEFTALGDNVNLASRLEGVNKHYKTYICCSESIFLKQKHNFIFRYLDNIKVKGKNNGVKIYELFGKKGEVSKENLEKIKFFEEGLKFYFQKNWIKAIEFFKKSENLLDNPSTIFITRCKYFLENPPENNWDGIWQMKEK